MDQVHVIRHKVRAEKLPVRQVARDLGISRNTVRRYLRDETPIVGHLSKKVDEILCKAILGAARLPLKDAIPFEAKCFGEVCGTEDMRIGVDNFLKNGPKAKAAFVHR